MQKIKSDKQILINVLLLFVVISTFFLISEIVIRVFFPVSDTIWTGDGVIGHKHIPNKQGIFVMNEHTSQVSFNEEGFRDINHNIENPQGKYRIAILGDSFVDALEVDFKDAFHQRLQKRLNEVSPNKYEIFNFGLYYFSTAQEYLLYNEYVKKYNPDEIWIFAFMNDPYEICLEDDKNPTFYFTQDKQVEQRPFYPNNYSSLELFISKYVKSAIFLRKTYYDFKRAVKEKENIEKHGLAPILKVFLKEYDNQTIECWNLTKYFIKELKKETEYSSTKLKIFIIPHPAILYKEDRDKFFKTITINNSLLDLNKPNELFKKMFEEEEVDYYDLQPVLEKQTQRSFYKIDGHFNEFGHEVISEFLFRNLYK